MDVQIFGTPQSSATRKATRFFKQRRIQTHVVDLRKRAASPRELERFAQKFGVQALIDSEAKRFRELGLNTAHYSDEHWLDLLAREPMLLRQPLVRQGDRLTIGDAEAEWRDWTAR
ncbi:MAG: arsenate reductase family protein [Longimicrobiales bacterium]